MLEADTGQQIWELLKETLQRRNQSGIL